MITVTFLATSIK